MTDPGDVTLATHEAAGQRYLEQSAAPVPALIAYLDQLAGVVGAGHVLELGSDPGCDAAHVIHWRESGVHEALARADWTVLSLDHVAGRTERWLYVLARAAYPRVGLYEGVNDRSSGRRGPRPGR